LIAFAQKRSTLHAHDGITGLVESVERHVVRPGLQRPAGHNRVTKKTTKPAALGIPKVVRTVRARATKKSAPTEQPLKTPFPIVGVGASAGGLEAFQELLRELPVDTGMGFVLVQHLDPVHVSALTQLLARSSKMPVYEATQNMRVEPNTVYVIPPNVQMAIAGGALQLSPRGEVRGAARSIDFFFKALAQDQRERAIGVVLSGTASDGTLGLEAIKAEGGLTFAQDDSAKYDSMPRSAIAAGCVDFVLPPQAMAAELARIANHPHVMNAVNEHALPAREVSGATASEGAGDDGARVPAGSRQAKQDAATTPASTAGTLHDGFRKILLLLRNHCGVDFSLYKSNTIERRVTRRLVLNKYHTLAEYAAFLKGNVKELDALYSDVLISVTSFFRNPEAFDVLKRKVFPKLLSQRVGDEPVRVWVLGCSTGQEAYSLAMAFAEAAADDSRGARLQIFATDLNEALLEKARHGLYAKSLTQDISPERLRRFFVEEDGGYRVTKTLREQIVFARQNVMSDPPFSRMDMVSCRNLLIYLEPELQKKIFPAFHYALKPSGFLFLGASESVGQFVELFAPADKKQKVFSRKAGATPTFRLPMPGVRETANAPDRRTPARMSGEEPNTDSGRDEFAAQRGEFNAQREADRISVSQFAPPGVIINAEGQVLQFRGSTGAYLEPPMGKASFDVLKMARDGLLMPLRVAINKAKREHKAVRRDDVHVRHDGGTRDITLQVIPLRNVKEPCFLILFEDATASPTGDAQVSAPRAPVGKREAASRVAELERELAETRDYLQSVQDQNEAGAEELQASTEELQSANEELQSINEELETSKEELESTNEELTTINDEMLSRNGELNRANADLNNVQVSIHTAILLLSRDLVIRRFTPPAAKIFNLTASDVGRAIGSVRDNLDLPNLETLLAEVVDTVSLHEAEVQDKQGCWYNLRARPYLTLDNKIDGVVLVLSDIDSIKRSASAVVSERDYAEAILRTAQVPLLVLRADLRVNTANEAFYETFEVEPSATEGCLIYEIGGGQWNIPKLRALLEEIIPRDNVFNGFEVTHEFAEIGARTMLLNARRLESAAGVPERILLSIEDISARKEAEEVLRQNRELFLAVIEQAPVGVYTLDAELRVQHVNSRALPTFAAMQPIIGRDFVEIVHGLWPAPVAKEILTVFRHTLETGKAYSAPSFTHQRVDRDVEESYEWEVRRILLPDGQRGLACYFSDITERMQAERALRESEEGMRLATDATAVGVWQWNVMTNQVRWDSQMFRMYGIEPTATGFVPFSEWCECVVPEDLPHRLEILRETVRVAGKSRGEFRIRRRGDWATRHIQSVETVRTNADGQTEWLVGTNLDVTVANAAQQLLRVRERELQSLADNTPDMLTRLDREHRHLFVNTAVEQATGLSAVEMMGKTHRQLGFPAQFCGLWESAIQAVFDSGQPKLIEFMYAGTAGARQYSTRFVPELNARGSIQSVLGVTVDNTNQMQLEQSLRAGDRRKDEFLATLAHELRNPLAPIQNAVEILKLSEVGQPTANLSIEIMDRQVNQMVRLIDDLLDVSRITNGKLFLRRERVSLSVILDAALEATATLMRQRAHELRLIPVADGIYLDGDPTRLVQIFTNLLTNAAKYTDVNGKITVTAVRDGSDVVVSVSDSGVGIPSHMLRQIFEMFSQVDRALEKTTGGLGIGLALVSGLVEMHGGVIEARSDGEGRGSEFLVRLPVLPDTLKPVALLEGDDAALESLRVLVVDDNHDAANSMATMLQLLGNNTLAVHDGEAAVLACENFLPDVVLLDIAMPKVNGYEACRQMRLQAWGSSVVIIALTGWGTDDDRQRTREFGFDHHLTKPVNLATLRAILSNVTPQGR
jgi:two-component system CheB/CheR fusion protein